jgi:hypothetical protein
MARARPAALPLAAILIQHDSASGRPGMTAVTCHPAFTPGSSFGALSNMPNMPGVILYELRGELTRAGHQAEQVCAAFWYWRSKDNNWARSS